MAKIGVLKPFRGLYDDIKDTILEDGEIAFEKSRKRIFMGNGTDAISSLKPFISNSLMEVSVDSTGTTMYQDWMKQICSQVYSVVKNDIVCFYGRAVQTGYTYFPIIGFHDASYTIAFVLYHGSTNITMLIGNGAGDLISKALVNTTTF